MAAVNPGYASLLSQLHNPSPSLHFSDIQGSFAHHLATSPAPTPLVATAVSSPLYLSPPLTHPKLQSFSTVLRHAAHLKYRSLLEAAQARSLIGAAFGKSIRSSMRQWVGDVVKGVQGGYPVLKLACCTGLLIGLDDLKRQNDEQTCLDIARSRGLVENEIVIAVAEVVDVYGHGRKPIPGVGDWEKEFQPLGQDSTFVALMIASQSLTSLPTHKLITLPLITLSRLLMSAISSTFNSGLFLVDLPISLIISEDNVIHIKHDATPLSHSLSSIISSSLFASIASISRLLAKIISILLDISSPSRLQESLNNTAEILQEFLRIGEQIDKAWLSSPLASASGNSVAPDSKETLQSMWLILKTFLFSAVMMIDAILSAVVYVPQPFPSSPVVTPYVLALSSLNTLYHLSFVISQFGGVTSTAEGFETLKRTFYLGLDILAYDKTGANAESFIQQLSTSSQRQNHVPALQAKRAFILASMEQLVPVLSNTCIRSLVWNTCHQHLFDVSHRETYESAHSVLLSIFASHTQKLQQRLSGFGGALLKNSAGLVKTTKIKEAIDLQPIPAEGREMLNHEDVISSNFVQLLVPFYARCLIENSAEGKLNIKQLRLAYSTLVKSAGACAFTIEAPPEDTYALAWYCIEVILDTIKALSKQIDDVKDGRLRENEQGQQLQRKNQVDRLHRLNLMLISTIPSLPLPLMLCALEEVRIIITASTRADGGAIITIEDADKEGKRKELNDSLFSEILERVGDREKEAAIRWWYKYRPILIQGYTAGGDDVKSPDSSARTSKEMEKMKEGLGIAGRPSPSNVSRF